MATLAQQLIKTKALTPTRLNRALFVFIKGIEKEFLDRNKEQIFEDSHDVFERALGYYSKATEVITGGRKKAGEPYDGKDTGKWLDGFYMQIVGGSEDFVMRFYSRDPKTSEILASEHWNSTEFFGLTDKNLKGVIEKLIAPFIILHYRKTLDV